MIASLVNFVEYFSKYCIVKVNLGDKVSPVRVTRSANEGLTRPS